MFAVAVTNMQQVHQSTQVTGDAMLKVASAGFVALLSLGQTALVDESRSRAALFLTCYSGAMVEHCAT